MEAESIRDEKVKIVRALRRIDAQSVTEKVVRGQYINGWIRGTAVPGYLDEDGCEMDSSDTETYMLLRRTLITGAGLASRSICELENGYQKVTEIVIQYKSLPHNIFGTGANIPNKLVIRLQPNEGIELSMVSKKQSLKERMSLNHTCWIWISVKEAILIVFRTPTSVFSSMLFRVINRSLWVVRKSRKAGVGVINSLRRAKSGKCQHCPIKPVLGTC